jgi:SAM-dependent methyltransferase
MNQQFPRLSVTGEVHRYLKSKIGEGDVVIDATLGNGYDTLFLAQQIGESGHLYGFDVQPEALAATADKLAAKHLSGRASLFLRSHATMATEVPEHLHGHIRCIMFNLGYLPGGDKSLTTIAESTLKALKQSADLLAPDGVISILAYTGHRGGSEEFEAVTAWANGLAHQAFEVSIHNLLPDHAHPPQWVIVSKCTVEV